MKDESTFPGDRFASIDLVAYLIPKWFLCVIDRQIYVYYLLCTRKINSMDGYRNMYNLFDFYPASVSRV